MSVVSRFVQRCSGYRQKILSTLCHEGGLLSALASSKPSWAVEQNLSRQEPLFVRWSNWDARRRFVFLSHLLSDQREMRSEEQCTSTRTPLSYVGVASISLTGCLTGS